MLSIFIVPFCQCISKCKRDCSTVQDDCAALALKDLASMRDGLADGPLNNKEAMDLINLINN